MPEAMYSCAYKKDGNMYITGSGSGKVYLWSGNETLSVEL